MIEVKIFKNGDMITGCTGLTGKWMNGRMMKTARLKYF